MTEISAALVKELREATGAGMMDCKRALQDTDGDLDAARTLLREKGMAQAGKRADRATTEGLVGTIVDGGVGTIVGIGCETEPVSKNDEFQAFAERVLRAVHADGVDAAASFDEERMELMGKLGENIVVAGAERYDDGGTIAAYVHPPANKIGVLVDLEGGDEALARQLAMHISFAAPEWATRDDVSPEAIEAERQVYLNSDEVLSKPEAAREKIVDGMLGKRFFAAAPGGVLVDQAWIHDQSTDGRRGARGGGRDAEGLQAGLGRGVVSAQPDDAVETAPVGRCLAVSPRAAEALGREPDGRPRVRRRPEDGRGDRARGRRGAATAAPSSRSSSAAATSTAAWPPRRTAWTARRRTTPACSRRC